MLSGKIDKKLEQLLTERSGLLAVLIVGPGYSNVARELISRYDCAQIDFIDYNQGPLDYQRSLLSGSAVAQRFIPLDLTLVRDLASFLEQTYDLVFFTEVLEHLTNDEGILYQLYSIMKPASVMVFSVPNGWADRFFIWLNPEYMQGHVGGHVNFYNANKITDLLKKIGFTIIKQEKVASEYFIFHLWLNLFKVRIDHDTGKIEIHSFIVKLGEIMMRLIRLTRIDVILNKIIYRNMFFILRAKQ